MHGFDEQPKIALAAEVRIDPGEIGYPIAVITRGLVPGWSLDRFVPEDGPEPDRRHTEMLDVVEPREQPAQITAVIETLGGGIESRDEPTAAQAAPIVAGGAVFEP